MKRKLIAKTFAGLEDVLVNELEQLGAEDIEKGVRMVSFSGDKSMLYRSNFCLRTAVRILMPIIEFKADNADEVYNKVRQFEWADYMDADSTFIVDAVVYSEEFRHSRFAAYRVKDAIADYFREKTGKRPNVSISNPDIRINLHIAENDVTISLDSSGESLHRRGYRVATVKAPLNEVLAAGMIMLTGWNGECDLIDPMCGSGTILIEAALIARNIYPGVFRQEFAFERWKDFDKELFESIYNDDSAEREFNHKIYGYDINRRVVTVAQENIKSAGVSDCVEVAQKDIHDFEQPSEKSLMITNPPYGERITTDDILGLYHDIGSILKRSFVGNDAWILSYHEECFSEIGFRPSTRIILYNGDLECEFRKYQIFEGKLSDRRSEGLDIKSVDDRRRNIQFKGRKRTEEHTEDTGTDEKEDIYSNIPRLNRHNFKWGDRGSDFVGEDDTHYFKSKPYTKSSDRKSQDHSEKPYRSHRNNEGDSHLQRSGFSDRKARESSSPFRKDKDSETRSDGRFDRDSRSFDRFDKRHSEKRFNRDKHSNDKLNKSSYGKRGDKQNGEHKGPRFSFDKDGRPIKKKE